MTNKRLASPRSATPQPVEPNPDAPWWRLLRPEDVYILVYMALSSLIVIVFWNHIPAPATHILARLAIAAFIVLYVPFAQRRRTDVPALLRDMYYMLCFIYFYIETSSLHTALWNHASFDDLIASIDHAIFGFQPSLRFARTFHQAWFSEFMNFCYTFYYFLFCLGGLVIWLRSDKGRGYGHMLHAVVMTMLFCYLTFDLFPTLGPQYRWADQYSRAHMAGYFWKYVLDSILAFGEVPTGAFPSSHVALATVFMFAFWRYSRKTFWIVLPIVAGLFCATVYIGVHYFADVPSGFLVGVAGWYASEPVRWAVVCRFGLYAYSPRNGVPQPVSTREKQALANLQSDQSEGK